MRKNGFAWLMILFALAFIPACGGDGDGGSNPQNPISFGSFVDGDLTNNTSETWTFTISGDTFISIDLYGSRLNQAAWSSITHNAPIVSVLDISSSPVGMPILTHNVSNLVGWLDGYRDTEVPLYLLKKTVATPTQTFEIKVSRQNPGAAGGPYRLRISNLTSDVSTNFGGHLTESELLGQATNNSFATAESLTPKIGFRDMLIFGHYEQGNPDFYSVNINTAIAPVIACFEIYAQRNGIWQAQTQYFDPELTFYSALGAPLNTVDDSFFSDSKICQKVTTTADYVIEVNESIAAVSSAAAGYILKYTEEPITNDIAESEPNNIPPVAAADVITDFGYLVTGSVTTATDPADWFSIAVTAGDLISIRQFDYENTVETISNSEAVKLEIFESDGFTAVPFNGPAPLVADGRLADLYADLTTTFFADTSGTYLIKVTVDSTITGASTRNYSFMVSQDKTSVIESEPNDTDLTADFLDETTATGSGYISTTSDKDFFELNSTAVGNLGISAGDLVAIHVYAARNSDETAFDITGYGSTLEPKITVYDNTVTTPFTVSTYIPDSTQDVAAEGINAPYPTLTAVFEATAAPAYIFRIESGNISTVGSSPSYLIEVFNLDQ